MEMNRKVYFYPSASSRDYIGRDILFEAYERHIKSLGEIKSTYKTQPNDRKKNLNNKIPSNKRPSSAKLTPSSTCGLFSGYESSCVNDINSLFPEEFNNYENNFINEKGSHRFIVEGKITAENGDKAFIPAELTPRSYSRIENFSAYPYIGSMHKENLRKIKSVTELYSRPSSAKSYRNSHSDYYFTQEEIDDNKKTQKKISKIEQEIHNKYYNDKYIRGEKPAVCNGMIPKYLNEDRYAETEHMLNIRSLVRRIKENNRPQSAKTKNINKNKNVCEAVVSRLLPRGTKKIFGVYQPEIDTRMVLTYPRPNLAEVDMTSTEKLIPVDSCDPSLGVYNIADCSGNSQILQLKESINKQNDFKNKTINYIQNDENVERVIGISFIGKNRREKGSMEKLITKKHNEKQNNINLKIGSLVIENADDIFNTQVNSLNPRRKIRKSRRIRINPKNKNEDNLYTNDMYDLCTMQVQSIQPSSQDIIDHETDYSSSYDYYVYYYSTYEIIDNESFNKSDDHDVTELNSSIDSKSGKSTQSSSQIYIMENENIETMVKKITNKNLSTKSTTLQPNIGFIKFNEAPENLVKYSNKKTYSELTRHNYRIFNATTLKRNGGTRNQRKQMLSYMDNSKKKNNDNNTLTSRQTDSKIMSNDQKINKGILIKTNKMKPIRDKNKYGEIDNDKIITTSFELIEQEKKKKSKNKTIDNNEITISISESSVEENSDRENYLLNKRINNDLDKKGQLIIPASAITKEDKYLLGNAEDSYDKSIDLNKDSYNEDYYSSLYYSDEESIPENNYKTIYTQDKDMSTDDLQVPQNYEKNNNRSLFKQYYTDIPPEVSREIRRSLIRTINEMKIIEIDDYQRLFAKTIKENKNKLSKNGLYELISDFAELFYVEDPFKYVESDIF